MNDIIINLFVIFAVTASAELTSNVQAPYAPSGWRPSGPEFRYPLKDTQISSDTNFRESVPASSYLPQRQYESRAFAQASLNIQLPEPSLRVPGLEQRSWNTRQDSRSTSQAQDSWNKPQSQAQNSGQFLESSSSRFQMRVSPTEQQSSYLPASTPDVRSSAGSQSTILSSEVAPSGQDYSGSDQSSYLPPANSGQFSESSSSRFGTKVPATEQQPSSYLPPATAEQRFNAESQSPRSSSGVVPSVQDFSRTDQSSYLPPTNSQYRFQTLQQTSYLSPPYESRAIPYTEYGPPSQQYGPPPSQEYGPPSTEATTTEQPTTEALTTTTEAEESITTELPVVVDARTEPLSANALDGQERSQKLTQNEEEGVYYVYHPSGLLQRIKYLTNDDQEGMVYSAKLRYENVEPINGPIYTYDPETFVFKRIN